MKKLFILLAILVLIIPPVFADSIKCYNLTLTLADTEYSQSFPLAKKITIQCRTAYDVRFSYVTGKVATPTAPYMTIKSGAAYWEDSLAVSGTTLYFASDEAGVVVEILVWR